MIVEARPARRRRRNSETRFMVAGYADVLRAVRSLELVPELIEEGPHVFSIRMTTPECPTLVLTDLWDPLPVTRSEQVGWTLSLIDGEVLSQSERPTAKAAEQIINPAVRQLRHRSSSAA